MLAPLVNILLVENEPSHCALIQRSFASKPTHHLTIATSIKEARKYLSKRTPDLIIADFRLDDGDGTQLIPTDSNCISCPIIIMTAHGDETTAVSALKAGAWDYFIKSDSLMMDIPRLADRAIREWNSVLEKNQANEMQKQLMKILNATPDLIAMTDANGFIQFLNPAGRKLLGYTSYKQLSGLRLSDLYVATDEKRIINEGISCAIQKGSWQCELKLLLPDDTVIPVSQVLLSHKCETGRGVHYFSTIARDIREIEAAKAKIEHLAYYDTLTNLPNRNELTKRLELEIKRAQRQKYFGAVLFIDLDNFKSINDSLGHPAGDLVLQQIATRLKAIMRRDDTIARLGGDEFVIILSGLGDDRTAAAKEAKNIALKYRDKISLSIEHNNKFLHVTGSIGIVIYPEEDGCIHQLLRFADTAMYHAKTMGKNTIEFFQPGMDEHVSKRLDIEHALHSAIEEEQFLLYYQPKINCTNNLIVGAEALIRWQHPEKGLIPPSEFIEILETSGAILDVGRWIMETAFRQIVTWLDNKTWYAPCRLSINISPRQFSDDNFVDSVNELLQITKVPPHLIDMEITEGVVIRDIEGTINKMTILTKKGISFSLDDFGTGYSSLSYLKRLPVSSLKIDRSFISDITHDVDDQAIVETILAMASHLNLHVIAEGIETKEQLNALKLL